MNLKKLKEVEDLKDELANLQEQCKNDLAGLVPLKKQKKQEFLDCFAEYFLGEGFAIKKSSDEVKASYKSLVISSDLKNDDKAENLIKIYRDQSLLADVILVQTNRKSRSGYSPARGTRDEFELEKSKIREEMKRVQETIEECKEPTFGCQILSQQRQMVYEDPSKLLKILFEE